MERINEKLEKILSRDMSRCKITIGGLNREYYWEVVHDISTGKVLNEDYLYMGDLISDDEYANIENLPNVIKKIRIACENKQFASYDTGRDKKCKIPGIG